MQKQVMQQSGWKRRALELLALFDPRQVMPEQVIPILRGGNSNLLANGLLTVLVAVLVRSGDLAEASFQWAVASCLTLIASYCTHKLLFRNGRFHTSTLTASWTLLAASALRGLVWGCGFILLMPDANLTEQTILGWMIAGIMCGGAFSAWPHPAAAVAFSGFVAIGGFLGMHGIPGSDQSWMPYAVIVMLLLLLRVVVANVLVLRHSVFTERDMAAQNEVIGLLLKDFEESSSDWLWETNATCTLTRGAERFANALPVHISKFESADLFSIINGFGEECDDNTHFHGCLLGREAFSGQVLSVPGPQGHCYIELSAKPVFAINGEFRGWRGVASNITAQRRADMEVRRLAHFDVLTELPNRAYFYEKLRNIVSAPLRNKTWIMYLDLDGFKSVNDTFGHAIGDTLLREVATRFEKSLPADAVLSRIGGDEFAVIFTGSKQRVHSCCRRILTCLQPQLLAGKLDVSVGVSIGIAEVTGKSLSPDELMRQADLALYRAKQEGKGAVRYFDESMDRQVSRRRAMENRLRIALAHNEFDLFYQPIHDIVSGQLVACEALLRWTKGPFGDVSPSEFIPIAEDAGLIAEIGSWVINRACRDAAKWPARIRVSLNMSPLQLKSNRILAIVTKALADSHLDPSRLELELTESALIENVDQTTRILAGLKSLGVRLALDDFGTGYSSLSHLHQFNFDKIKIDRSFVQSFAERKESAAVVNAVVHLARDLGMITTAEGVETEEHLRAMRAVGCTQAQGFLFGTPCAVDDLALPKVRKAVHRMG